MLLLNLRWRIDLLSLGLVAFAAFATSHFRASDEPTPQALISPAPNGRAVWRDFLGFNAKIKATVDGKTAEGTLPVSSSGQIELKLPSDEQFGWVKNRLQFIVDQRLSHDAAIETVAFVDDEVDHPLGRLLKSTKEDDKSLWRVKGDVLTEVHRFQGSSHFVISVMGVTRMPEGKHLPQNFNVTTWESASNQIKTSRHVYNQWSCYGALYQAGCSRSSARTLARGILNRLS